MNIPFEMLYSLQDSLSIAAVVGANIIYSVRIRFPWTWNADIVGDGLTYPFLDQLKSTGRTSLELVLYWKLKNRFDFPSLLQG